MLGSNSVRFRVAVGAALSAAIAAGILACAGSSGPPAEPDGGTARLSDVRVESSMDASTITLVGPGQAVFTAFQQEEPDRIVVDLADVEVGEVASLIPVGDGLVEEVHVEALSGGGEEGMTRVEVVLSGASSYDVRADESGVVIEVSAASDMAEGDAEPEIVLEDPWAVEPEAEDAMDSAAWEEGAEPMADEAMADETLAEDWQPEPVPALPATRLESIDARGVGAGSIVHLVADGTVESAVTFTLEDPSRLVVDLPAIESQVGEARIEVGTDQIQRIRVGEHTDKIRVVVDGGTAASPFEGRRVIPVPTGLLVALGAGAELEDEIAMLSGPADTGFDESLSMAEAGDEMAPDAFDTDSFAEGEAFGEGDAFAEETASQSAAAPAEGVMIFGVSLEAEGEADRVVVLAEEPVDYFVYEPDPETVVLSIEGAVISPEANVRLAPAQRGAVSLVTSFSQPDVDRPEVRVVVKRAPNLKPEVSRRGSVLIMDFPRTGALAATPPVYDDPELGQLPGTDPMPAGADLPAGDDFAMVDGGDDMAGYPMAPADGGAAALPMDEAPLDMPLADVPADPAAGDPPAAIEILNEGGLLDGKEYVGRRISLDFKEVDVADVLRLIAEVSGLNVIAGDEVSGAVTIRLVDVPWDQALDVVLLTKGLGFVRIGNVLRVASAEVLAQEEETRLQERRAKEQLEDLVVKLQPVNYADVKDVSKMVKELLTPRGSVNTDSRTNTIIIKDIASVIDEATALVKAVDTMTPQVMIEAKIVEASLDFSRELGTVWTFGTNPATEAGLGGRDYIFQGGADDGIADGFGNQVVFGNPITAGPTGILALAATVLDEKFNYEVELQAAEVNGDGKVISSPRVVTLDNSTAKIQQGVSIPFQTFENGDAQLEFVDAVLSLDVTPHITSDRSIIMDIEVSRNAPDDSVFTLTGSPAIAKNQVKTETLVKDGQTLVLGGIYVVNRSQRQSRVPFLNRLPLLGNLFKSDEFSDARNELLVFVSPRIVQTPSEAI